MDFPPHHLHGREIRQHHTNLTPASFILLSFCSHLSPSLSSVMVWPPITLLLPPDTSPPFDFGPVSLSFVAFRLSATPLPRTALHSLVLLTITFYPSCPSYQYKRRTSHRAPFPLCHPPPASPTCSIRSIFWMPLVSLSDAPFSPSSQPQHFWIFLPSLASPTCAETATGVVWGSFWWKHHYRTKMTSRANCASV